MGGVRPCPTCGIIPNHIRGIDEGKISFVICDHCGSTGSYAKTPEEALKNWNRGEIMKPCPVCGHRAEIILDEGINLDEESRYFVACTQYKDGHKIATKEYKRCGNAIKAWNDGRVENAVAQKVEARG